MGKDIPINSFIQDAFTNLEFTTYVDGSANGLETPINKHDISGGEAKKISLLRILSVNSDVLLFDEPATSLDGKTASLFIEYLTRISRDKIIIISSHDPLIQRKCDVLLDLNEVIC